MADGTHIEWTDATWNPVTGCSVVSPGCTNCYAMKLAGTRLKHHPSREGLTRETKAGPVWTGEVRFNREWLTQPLGWKRPRRIFVCAHGDLFAEGVPDEWIDQVFAVMVEQPVRARLEITQAEHETILHVRSTCEDPASELSCNDDFRMDSVFSLIEIDRLEPGTYFVIVDGFRAGQDGPGELTIELTAL